MPVARRARSTSRTMRVGVPVTTPSIWEIRSSVCALPRSNRAATRAVASCRVMRPRSTASSTASWTRSRVSTTTSRGSRKRASCSRTPALSLALRVLEEEERERELEELFFLPVDWRGGGMSRRTLLDCSIWTNEQLEQRLLRMTAVLGLVPDALAVAVEHRLADLLAGMGGEAVQRDRTRGGAIEQRV